MVLVYIWQTNDIVITVTFEIKSPDWYMYACIYVRYNFVRQTWVSMVTVRNMILFSIAKYSPLSKPIMRTLPNLTTKR